MKQVMEPVGRVLDRRAVALPREPVEAVGMLDNAKARRMRADGATLQMIADMFGVSTQRVHQVVRDVEVIRPAEQVTTIASMHPLTSPRCSCPHPIVETDEDDCLKCGRRLGRVGVVYY